MLLLFLLAACGDTLVFSVGGTVTGLQGSGLALQNNGGDDLPITSNGPFTFSTQISDGIGFAVTVLSQPANPDQVCTVTGGVGIIQGAAVAGVTVTCAPSYPVSGEVSGLLGSGLALQLNGGEGLPIAEDGPFTFRATVPDGDAYSVTVQTQPSGPDQLCAVADGQGTIAGAAVAGVTVTCAIAYSVGGAVSGLQGPGLVLQNNGGDDLPIGADGGFTFSTLVPDGEPYAVTVLTHPTDPDTVCAVTNGEGVVDGAAVTGVTVTCLPGYEVGGAVSGLEGSGLVLQNNGADDLPIGADGDFTFPLMVADGTAYAVTVLTQPTRPDQVCLVSGGEGIIESAAAREVSVTCQPGYAVGGTVAGMEGVGLVLQNNGGDDLEINADGAFTFPALVADGAAYVVTVATQPSVLGLACSVEAGEGVIAGAAVTDVAVVCSTGLEVAGTVSGLSGGGLVLQNNGEDDLAITDNGAFTFPATLADAESYDVTVLTYPSGPTQLCTVAGGAGVMVAGVATEVAVTCVSGFTVGATVGGLAGSGLVLQNNGGDDLAVTADDDVTFTAPLLDGESYEVSVAAQPSSPSQTCTVGGAEGVVDGADVESVTVTCTVDEFSIGGAVSGLEAGVLELSLNGAETLTLTGNGSFTFATGVADLQSYEVTVAAQPLSPPAFCAVSNGTGSPDGAAVTSVAVTCQPLLAVGGSITGLEGTGLVLRNNGGDDLSPEGNGPFAFDTLLVEGASYAVTVLTHPTSPTQFCQVTGGSGTVGAEDVDSVGVACTTDVQTVGGSVTGLLGSGLVLVINDGDPVEVAGDGTFTFPTALLDGASFDVTVQTQPVSPFQLCTVEGGAGTLDGEDVSSVAVSCTNTYAVSGFVTGLSGSGLVLQNNGGDSLSTFDRGGFIFATRVPDGAAFDVTVLVHPTALNQQCTPDVETASGTIDGADVDDVIVDCETLTYSVGGSVAGLAGGSLVLQNNEGDDLELSADGAFAFETALTDGSSYDVTILTQPDDPEQECSVFNAAGNLAGSNVGTIFVQCFEGIAPLYPTNGANWNQYVVNDGDDPYSASDADCIGNESALGGCVHGGELRVVLVGGQTDCTGVTASDDLGAFDWICLPNPGAVAIVSTGLKPTMGLADLIDWSGTPEWKPNAVTVLLDGQSIGTTPAAVWWGNIIEENSTGTGLSTPGTIYVVTANPAAPYTLEANETALVVQPGVTLQASALNENVVSAGVLRFIWVEGDIDADGDDVGVHWSDVDYSVLRWVTISNANGVGTLSAESYATPREEVKAAPINVYATTGDGEVTVGWGSVTGATYNLYWATSSPVTTSATLIAGASRPYLHESLSNGTTYYYRVTAVTSAGESALSPEASSTPQVTAAGIPAGLDAQARDGQIAVSWDTVGGATAYRVYRDVEPGVTSEGDPLAEVTTTFLTDMELDNGTTYYYVVTAVVSETESGESAETFATPQMVYPTAPTRLYAASHDQSVTLDWQSSTTADSFNVYRSTSSPVVVTGGNLIANESTASYTDDASPLTNGTAYFYVVTAVNTTGESVASAEAVAVPREAVNFAPEGLAVAAENGRNRIKWNSVGGSTGYILYWSTSPVVDPATADFIESNIASYLHNGLDNGTTYYYTVLATGPSDIGLYLTGSAHNRIQGLTLYDNVSHGMYMNGGSDNHFRDVISVGNGNDGINLSGGANNRYSNVIIADNGGTGFYDFIGGGLTVIDRMRTVNNGDSGLHFWGASNYAIHQLIAANNGGSGYSYYQHYNTFVVNFTANNNGDSGMGFQRGSNNTLMNFAAVGNDARGLVSSVLGGDNTYMNLGLTNNGTEGLVDGRYCCSTSSTYTGLLLLGNNGGGSEDDCNVSVVADLDKGILDDCSLNAASDATVVQGEDGAASFLAEVGSPGDSENGDDTDGQALYDDLMDWVNFENDFRHWGRSAEFAFPDTDTTGECLPGEMCQMWDWQLVTGDATLLERLAVPSGNDVGTHRWSMNEGNCAIINADWDSELAICTTTYLRNAVEVRNDGVGNDNLLCESGETCLFTPNLGAYQGHVSGDPAAGCAARELTLVGDKCLAASIGTGGTVESVTLLRYDANGR